MSIPKLQRAIIQSDDGTGTLVQTSARAVPEPGPNQILVKTVAVALNPCDWKMPTNFPITGAGVGSDYAGYVACLGPGTTDLTVGARVAGAVHASNPIMHTSGAYAEYIVAEARFVWRIPEHMSWADAATIGLCGIGTVNMAMVHELALPGSPEEPAKKPDFVFVYGGSTSNGTVAIQLLKLSGFRVVTTCSPRNFDLVESYGAEKAFDYNSATCVEDIRAYTGGNLKYAMDIIAEAKSLKLCYAALGRAGGRYVGFELIPDELKTLRRTVKAGWVLGIRMSGEEIALDKGYGSPANPELANWGGELCKRIEKLVQQNKLRAHPAVVHENGLDGIIEGVEKLQRREVSGCKLVYMI
ncbi:putative zinc-binding dehydrogenase family oxidoreductase [Hypoxylon crocopeplum]|nr:putative zinc-binding dehydrogenase family oxidoreductase [Hypoxylon crocopeplum]